MRVVNNLNLLGTGSQATQGIHAFFHHSIDSGFAVGQAVFTVEDAIDSYHNGTAVILVSTTPFSEIITLSRSVTNLLQITYLESMLLREF
jgi:hypothetical protein